MLEAAFAWREMQSRKPEAVVYHPSELPQISPIPHTPNPPQVRQASAKIDFPITELLERYATALGTWPHVVATGGDAGAVPGELVDSFVPELVLQGAALAWEHGREAGG